MDERIIVENVISSTFEFHIMIDCDLMKEYAFSNEHISISASDGSLLLILSSKLEIKYKFSINFATDPLFYRQLLKLYIY